MGWDERAISRSLAATGQQELKCQACSYRKGMAKAMAMAVWLNGLMTRRPAPDRPSSAIVTWKSLDCFFAACCSSHCCIHSQYCMFSLSSLGPTAISHPLPCTTQAARSNLNTAQASPLAQLTTAATCLLAIHPAANQPSNPCLLLQANRLPREMNGASTRANGQKV